MIPVTTIINRIKSALDAEGFDHYKFNEDFKPAINYAQDWITQLYSRVLGDKKFSEEMLRELTYIRVWKTSIFGRIIFNTSDIGGELWSVLGVFPEAEVTGNENPPFIPLDGLSYITDYLYLSANYSAERKPLEFVNENRKNPFSKGNEIITGDLRTYAYTTMVDINTLFKELSVIPSTGKRQIVAVSYLLQPKEITLITDNVNYPISVLPLLVDKSIEWISWKQGDSTNLKSVSDADVQKLIQLTT